MSHDTWCKRFWAKIGREEWKQSKGDNYVYFQAECLGEDCGALFDGEENMRTTATEIVQRTYSRMTETTTRQHNWNVRKPLKDWSWDEVIIEDYRMSSRE